MKINKTGKISVEEIKAIVALNTSKADRIRKLFDGGLEIKEIATAIGCIYNQAFNTVSNYVNMNDIETVKVERPSSKQRILDLAATGLTKIQIQKIVKCQYNYIVKVLSDNKSDSESVSK